MRYPVIIALLLLVGCHPKPTSQIDQSDVYFKVATEHYTDFVCSTDGLQYRFKGAADKGTRRYAAPVPAGIIRVEYGNTGRAGFFRASEYEALDVLSCFDSWESHPPEVTYKSFGNYPRYVQRVVSGGCEHGESNCQN